LLTSDAVSKSASPQKAITRLPPRWRISQGPQRADRGRRTQFFGELAAGGLLRILRHIDLAFRDRPGAVVLLAPVRPAGMDEQHFRTIPRRAIGQYARAQIGLRGSLLGGRHYILGVWLETSRSLAFARQTRRLLLLGHGFAGTFGSVQRPAACPIRPGSTARSPRIISSSIFRQDESRCGRPVETIIRSR
jgi:hypothetical protein